MESTTVAVKPSAPQHPEGPAEATNTAERAPSTAPAPAADDAQTEAVPDVSESQPGASHPPMPPPHHSGPPPPWHYGPPPPHMMHYHPHGPPPPGPPPGPPGHSKMVPYPGPPMYPPPPPGYGAPHPMHVPSMGPPPMGYPPHPYYHPMGPPPPHGHPGMGPAQVISVEKQSEEGESANDKEGPNPAEDSENPSTKEDAKKIIDVDATEGAEEGNGASDKSAVISAGPSVTKAKKEGEEETGTPATVNETLSEISPSAFLSAERAAQAYGPGDYSGAPSYIYHTAQRPYHPGSPPNSSPSYFSRITGPPSAYYAHPPPPPGSSGEESASGRRLAPMPPPPPGAHVYQYQLFDPRSDVDAPMPPKRRVPGVSMTINNPYYHGGSMVNVPPTVHMPQAGPGPVVKDLISPLPNFSAIKTGKSVRHPIIKHEPSTPEKESEAASGLASMSAEKKVHTRARDPKSSPLHLLSQVSTSPAVPPMRRHQSRYSYPPPHGHYPEYMKSEEDPTATPAPKSHTACDLILSAANTIEKDGKKRKSLGDVDDVKKKLHKKGPSANLFDVGGYPPGIDPSSLPPGRKSEKAPPKALQKKMIDPTTAEQAEKAGRLAQLALERPRVGKQLLLSMALIRTNPRTPPSCYPAHGTVLGDRFHWAAYPPLDMVLRKHMEKYYELSTSKCQSREQQEFNNELVQKIRDEARRYGWEFDEKKFDDKKIRDRIRCFYKTHIQNAKKRLKTMLRNPDKRANIKALAAHFHLIEDKAGDEEGNDREEYDNDSNANEDDDGRQSSVPEHDSIGFGLSQSYSNESGYGDDDNNYSKRYSSRPSHRQSYESSEHDNNDMLAV